MTRVLIVGNGRMGTIIRELVEADESCELAGIVGIETMDTLAERRSEERRVGKECRL